MTEPAYIEQGATFNETRTHRYTLIRRWAAGATVLFIMLNPSTADETVLDPTLRRCLGFARAWDLDSAANSNVSANSSSYLVSGGYGAFEVCNLYAYRSTSPKKLWLVRDPVGPDNDAAILAAAQRASLVIVGWGGNAKPDRERRVAQMLADAGIQPYALRLIKNGSPEHPLYIPEATVPRPWLCKGLR